MTKTLSPDWNEIIGQRVRLYRNLRNKLISVQVKVAGRGWQVIGHLANASLTEVTFSVNETKRQYLIKVRNKRDVCAYAEGVLQSEGICFSEPLTVEVGFNPFLSPHFFERNTGRILHPCQLLQVRGGRVYVSEDALLKGGCVILTLERSQIKKAQAFWKLPAIKQPVCVAIPL